MFRLYLEYARLISPDRDNGKMVCVLDFAENITDQQDFVLEDRHVATEDDAHAAETGLPEGTILDVSDR
jgi:hypothetical protein